MKVKLVGAGRLWTSDGLYTSAHGEYDVSEAVGKKLLDLESHDGIRYFEAVEAEAKNAAQSAEKPRRGRKPSTKDVTI